MPLLRFDHLTDGTADLPLGWDCAGPTTLCLRTPADGTADLNFGGIAPPIPGADVIVSATMPECVPDIVAAQLTDCAVAVVMPECVPDILALSRRECVINATVAECTPLINVYRAQDVVIDAVMAEPVIESNSVYIVDVWRGQQARAAIPHNEAAHAAHDSSLPITPLNRLRGTPGLSWALGAILKAEAAPTWEYGLKIRNSTAPAWQEGNRHQARARVVFEFLTTIAVQARPAWDNGQPRRVESETGWSYPDKRRIENRLPWGETARLTVDYTARYDYPPSRRIETRLPWEYGVGVVSLWPRPDPWIPPEPPLPRVITPDLALLCERYLSGFADIIFGQICTLNLNRIPRRRVYRVLHDISLIRVSDNLPIPASSIELDYSADSWAWGARATLLGRDALEAVLPVNGEPVKLKASINGYEWIFLAEDWTENLSFGKRSVSITGRGLTALLSPPYAPTTTGATDSAMTAQQAFNSLLPLDNSWVLTWASGTPDWLLPAGAFAWSAQSAIQAIHAAAVGVGLIVIPSRTTQAFTVAPRYPVLPWHYGDETPGLIIPDSAIMSVTRQQAIPAQADACFVHGAAAGGILARCYLTETLGEYATETGQSDLITHIDAAYLFGARRIAAQAQQPEVKTIKTLLGGVFPLAQIGALLEIELDGDNVRGLINSVNVSAQVSNSGATVSQSLTIGESTSSQWARYRRLAPGDPLRLGTITADNGDGTMAVTLVGGGVLRARGGGTIGQTVYVRNGAIDGVAPSLPSYDVEIF